MERVYIESLRDGRVGGAAANHIRNVLRLRRGDVFLGYDGLRELCLRVEDPRGAEVAVAVEAERELPPAPGGRIILAPALVKGPRWDWLLEKAAELGVGEIAPVAAERCVVRIPENEAEEKTARWKRVLGAAAAQCAGRVPLISGPVALSDFLSRVSGAPNKFLLILKDGARPLAESASAAAPGKIVLLIGPEGDWTEDEAAAAEAAGFQAASLGPLILRAETAALAASVIAAVIPKH